MEINKKILKSINVLYVEDENDVRDFTARTIGNITNSVVKAENGLVGLEKFKLQYEDKTKENFDIVVTDINMPKMNGLEMCEEIQKIDSSIPIVITTAHNDSDFLKNAIKLGVRGYAMKPVDLRLLIESINLAVEPRALKKELEAKVAKKTLEIRSILDSQENIIVVTNGTDMIYGNKALFNFFEKKDMKDLKNNFACICETFEDGDDYFSLNKVPRGKKWTDEVMNYQTTERIVKIIANDNTPNIFNVTVNKSIYDEEYAEYVVTLNNITQLHQQKQTLEYQANHDNLTGLYNRQKINKELDKEINRHNRYKQDIAIIMLDIDHFKQVNDTYGHDVGDEVLISMAELAMQHIRNTDILARWGGEEFMLLLPEISLDEAKLVAEKLRKDIENTCLTAIKACHITSSFGVTIFKEDDNKTSFLKRVDEALYEAKETGRNQVIVR